MKYLIISLAITGPLIGILYSTLDYFGILDKWTKNIYAQQALDRLQSTTGFPESWIYNDSIDQPHFNTIFRIIKKNTKEEKIKNVLRKGIIPALLTVGGEPILIKGIPKDWPQEKKYTYTDNHPILMAFNVSRYGNSKGKGDVVCTIGELKVWVNREKRKYDYIVGVVVIGFIAIAIALWQTRLPSK